MTAPDPLLQVLRGSPTADEVAALAAVLALVARRPPAAPAQAGRAVSAARWERAASRPRPGRA
ncbi:acyl-CoA carboxylase epsilon subunit [Kitasatospora sp. NPDC101183]|uniref:acyl-CoA carboxylase epsilon subunit n=1 Tax=Kitasatospora sp. NPDC101183 TaxID=3364100 RepID=UPI00380A9AE6